MNSKKKILVIFEVIILMFIILKAYELIKYNYENNKINDLNKKAQFIKEKEIVKSNDNNNLLRQSEENIERINSEFIENFPDYVGYIDILGTNISYPIVQGFDNEFYINHSPDKSKNANGSIFLDYRNQNFIDDNTILYGHYIKNGKFFYQLDRFKDQSFYDKFNKINIDTIGARNEYLIYSVYITNPEENYRQINFESLEDKKIFLDKIKSKSIIETIDINYDLKDAKIITLSTCSDKGTNRLVIHAILID